MSAFTTTPKPTTRPVQTLDDWLRLTPAQRSYSQRHRDAANEAEYAQQMQQVEDEIVLEDLRRGSSYLGIAMDEERHLRDSTQLSDAELTPGAAWFRISARVAELKEAYIQQQREFYADLRRRAEHRPVQSHQEAQEELALGAPYFQFAHREEMSQLAAQHLCYEQLTFDERRTMADRTLARACEMAREEQRRQELAVIWQEIAVLAYRYRARSA